GQRQLPLQPQPARDALRRRLQARPAPGLRREEQLPAQQPVRLDAPAPRDRGGPVLDVEGDHDGIGNGMTTALIAVALALVQSDPPQFLERHCMECHDRETKKGGLDLTALKPEYAKPEVFARWVKVHDRIQSGEMPPKKPARPPAEDVKAVVAR